MNPFDLPGPAFLAVYVLGAVVMLAATAIVDLIRRGPWDGARDVPPLTGPELGYLADGARGAALAGIAAAVHAGRAELRDRRVVATAADGPALDPISERVIAAARDREVAAIADHLEREPALFGRLRAHRLLRSRPGRLVHGAPLLAWLGVGAIKVAIGVTRHRPVGLLLLAMLGLGAAVALWAPTTVSGRGAQLLDRTRTASRALAATAAAAPAQLSPAEMSVACALDGVGAVPALAPLAPREATATGVSSCSSGCGSGCGGGCGGCGGCS